MRISEGKIFLLLVIIVISVSSCSVRRGGTRYQTMSQRAEVTLEWNERAYTMSSAVRVWKNELVVLSVQPMLGIEMMRMEATADSVWVFDKMNRRYVALSYDDMAGVVSPQISYKAIQDFASKPIANGKQADASMSLRSGKHELRLSCRFTNREYNTLQAPVRTKTTKYKRVSLRDILPI